ncbi:MAG TPA: class A beta-lactamase-related serine hydrolase [Myxococcales bacterium]|nr:class A beta-lactamase-related serine hydrolase [Myxococcales bacterium]
MISARRFLPSSFSAAPEELEALTNRGQEIVPESVGVERPRLEGLWRGVEALYQSGAHPAIQLCLRKGGAVIMDRSIGQISGRAFRPGEVDPDDVIGLDTPVNLFSASKALTAMLVHKLDEANVLRLDDRVADYIPDFARHGKGEITVRHVLAHRAGLAKLPPEAFDLDLLTQPERMLEVLCDIRPESSPGGRLAYHAVTGGFILGEVVCRATNRDLRDLLREKIADPLGLHWLNYGVAPDRVNEVAINAATGLPLLPPLSSILQRALSTDLDSLIRLSNDERFLTGVIPSANVITTAGEIATFYQCLLDEGLNGEERVFDARTIRQATEVQTGWELDFTLMAPIPYSLGFMLGSRSLGLFGFDNPRAFGHVGLSNVFTWADPERELVVALLTTGKPILGGHIVPLLKLLRDIGRVFPKTAPSV